MNDYHKRKKTFQILMKACHEQDAYSVSMVCSKANISYAQIKTWAQDDEIWAHALEMCQTTCESNIEIALIMKRLTIKEAIYVLEKSL